MERGSSRQWALGGTQVPFSDWAALCAFGPYVEGANGGAVSAAFYFSFTGEVKYLEIFSI